MPMLAFEGCRERIWRAEVHSKELSKLWNEFVEDDRYSTIVEVEDDGTGGIWVEPEVSPFPAIFSFELGEMLYHLRAVLDSCIYEAAILETGQNPPSDERSLEFPIRNTSEEFKKAAWHIKPLTDKRRRIVESVQPYNAPEVSPDIAVFSIQRMLGILNDWASKDRHRRLHVIASWASQKNPFLRLPDGVHLSYMLVTGEGFLEHDSQIAAFGLEGWKPGMRIEANANLAIDIALNEPPPPCADSDTLGNRIRMMLASVKTVVNGFETSFESDK